MKKTFQIFRDIKIPAASAGKEGEKNLSEQLRESYAKCTGVFVTAKDTETDFSALTIGLKVAQYEILPQGTDLSLLAFNGKYPLAEALYDFSKEGAPSRSCEMECTLRNSGSKPQTVNLYFVLEND